MRELDIGEIQARTGIPASTLRFYEETRLIRSIGRQGLRRQFNAGVLERLALITLARAAGFSLDEIRSMLDSDSPDGRPRIDRQKLTAKAGELDETIRQLAAMRDGLRHAAACRAPSHMECPTFQRLLRAAAKGAIGGGRKRKGKLGGYRPPAAFPRSGLARSRPMKARNLS